MIYVYFLARNYKAFDIFELICYELLKLKMYL